MVNSTRYNLMVLVDGDWYMSYYSVDEYGWDHNLSITDIGPPTDGSGDGGSSVFAPTGSFIYATHNTKEWTYYLGTTGSTVRYSECQLRLQIGDIESNAVTIPSSLHMTIPISVWPATGYDIVISDLNGNGEIDHWETIVVGPLGQNVGRNAEQPPGTSVTLILVYAATGGTIASHTFTV